MKDFFISYTSSDRSWAEWIAWELEAAGYGTIIQAWDFRPGENFVLEMQAAAEAERTLLVLSESYFQSSFAQSEWAAAFAQDPTGAERRLVPVCVGRCEPRGVLRALIFIDLVDLDEDTARERLLEGVLDGRGKPESPPAFPGGGGPRPAFPGKDAAAPALAAVPPPREPRRSSRARGWWRGAVAYACATGFTVAAFWSGLLGAVRADTWTERHFLAHMQRYLPPPDTSEVIVVRGRADGPLGAPGVAWRAAHAEMVDALSAAGARVIAFDLSFEQPSEHDALLAEAIARAHGRGTAVVVGARSFQAAQGNARPRLTRTLAEAPVSWGTLAGDAAGRRLELARLATGTAAPSRLLDADAVPVVPSLALQAVMRYDAGAARPVAAVLRRDEDAIEVRGAAGDPPLRTIPVLDRRGGFLVDVAGDLQSYSYQDLHRLRARPDTLGDVAGKLVVVGYEVDEEKWTDGPSQRYEMDVQASAIAQILHGAHLKRPGFAAQLALIFGLGALGWALRGGRPAWTRHRTSLVIPAPVARRVEVPTALVGAVLVYAIAAFVAGKSLRVVPRFTYDLTALVLTYAALGWATRGLKRPRFPRAVPRPPEHQAVA